jgi:adenylate cyclase
MHLAILSAKLTVEACGEDSSDDAMRQRRHRSEGGAVAETRLNRRLTAILAADIVGYSRLMRADEAGTLEALRNCRSRSIDPAIAEHHGRVVKTTGDGFLAEFASVVDAVQCAVAIQNALGERNAVLAAEKQMVLRIGINVGDVIIEDSDIYGDGVNLAARLEEIAEPGGIFVSRAVYDQVRDKLPLRFDDLGERAVKNISRPIRIFSVILADRPPPAAALAKAQDAAAADRPSIVVLAFQNMSGDPEQEYFSDGIAEDIITDLSKISSLLVIARNSAFAYKGRAVDLRSVSRELGVRYVLEGSVRKAGKRIRVNAQLIDGASGGHVWAERYDRDLTDIFAVQDELTRQIVDALSVKLTKSEQRQLQRRPTENLEAYDQFLRARENFFAHTRASVGQARRQLEMAITLDPRFSAAYGLLAMINHIESINVWSASSERSLDTAHELALKAVEIDDGDPVAHCALASTRLWRREHDKALVEAKRTIDLDPNFAQGYHMLGWVHLYSGRPAEALEQFQTLMRLDPHYPDVYLHFMTQALFQLGRYEEAIETAKQRIARNPNTDITRVLLAASYGQTERAELAREEWKAALRINPEYSLEHRRRTLPYKDPRQFDPVIQGLHKAGIEP